jgi:hypothetical protein
MLRNKLTGTVPTFGKNTLYLDLGSNYLEGPLPSDITIYPELTMLYLDHNTFQGTVPKLYAKHSGIQQLWLNNNKFTGTFPDFSSTAALCKYNLIYFVEAGPALIFNRNYDTIRIPTFTHCSVCISSIFLVI